MFVVLVLHTDKVLQQLSEIDVLVGNIAVFCCPANLQAPVTHNTPTKKSDTLCICFGMELLLPPQMKFICGISLPCMGESLSLHCSWGNHLVSSFTYKDMMTEYLIGKQRK
jgi:hypothetical protein